MLTYEDPAKSGFMKIGHAGKPRYRAGSLRVGQCEHRVSMPLPASVLANLVLVARLTDRHTRQSGKRNGDLGHIATETLDWLRLSMKPGEGYVSHAFSHMAKRCNVKRSRSAIVAAVHRLVDSGWLRMVRRKDEDGQAINAYGFSLPRSACPMASRLFGRTDDVPADILKDFDTLCERFPRWKAEWFAFIQRMKMQWRREGHPVSEGRGGSADVLDSTDTTELPVPVVIAPPPPSSERVRDLSRLDAILASIGGPHPHHQRTSRTDILIGSESVQRSQF